MPEPIKAKTVVPERDEEQRQANARELREESGVGPQGWLGHGGDRRSRLWRSQVVSMGRALAVLVHTPHIRAYLEKHDPKALELAERALRGEGEKHAQS